MKIIFCIFVLLLWSCDIEHHCQPAKDGHAKTVRCLIEEVYGYDAPLGCNSWVSVRIMEYFKQGNFCPTFEQMKDYGGYFIESNGELLILPYARFSFLEDSCDFQKADSRIKFSVAVMIANKTFPRKEISLTSGGLRALEAANFGQEIYLLSNNQEHLLKAKELIDRGGVVVFIVEGSEFYHTDLALDYDSDGNYLIYENEREGWRNDLDSWAIYYIVGVFPPKQ